jgi:electron transfer flavoprotein beta subunit
MEGDINPKKLPLSMKKNCTIEEDAIQYLTFDDFDDNDPTHYGLLGSATQVEKIFQPEIKNEKVTPEGDCNSQAEAIFNLLSNKKFI